MRPLQANSLYYRTSRLVTAACLLAAGSAVQVQAAPVNYLVLGDSISDGVGATNGYSYYLQDLFVENGLVHGVDYDFIGGQVVDQFDTPSTFLSDGVTPFDADGWGIGGHTAASTPNSLRAATASLAYDFQNSRYDDATIVGSNDGIFTNNVSGSRVQAVANVVLLHIGTNQLNDEEVSPSTQLDPGTTATASALPQLDNLFTELRIAWDNGDIATDARIMVAQIVPRGRGNNADSTSDHGLRNSARYNALIQGIIDDLPEADTDDIAFKALFTDLTDMFQIEATQELADSLGVTLGQLDNDGDPWVDWVAGQNTANGSITALDEANPLSLPAQGGSGPTILENSVLLNPDRVHPTDVGYDLIAHQWYNALLSEGIVPEPSSMALLALGGLALLRRRRPA